MPQNSFPDNVPSAKQGTADGLAAPGRVGAGDTLSLAQFEGWLAKRRAEAFAVPGLLCGESPDVLRARAFIDAGVMTNSLLILFKLEQGE